MAATKFKALIAGATGAASRRLIELLASDASWSVVGVSRSPPRAPASRTVAFAAADLTQPDSLRDVLASHPGVTHVFYCCRAKHAETGVESVDNNVAMFKAVLDAVAGLPSLQHIHLVEGGKWYGMHLGPFPTPAMEDDPRHMPPNFYYDQEDLLRARQQGQRWAWSASRPNFISDFAPERARNIVTVLGTWAAFCRELGTPLDFPGKPAAFIALAELTDATHYARAMRHIATSPACANDAFNVTNGEPYRWQRIWPRLARLYGLEVGVVRPLRLAQWMADKEPLWRKMIARHGLIDQPMDLVVRWDFADFALNQEHDVFYSMHRLRGAGFSESADTANRLIEQITRYREARILP